VQVNLSQLRKVAAVRGLVNSRLRARVWPLLLGISTAQHGDGDYEAEAYGEHADVKTINDDVARSLHSFTAGEDRTAAAAALQPPTSCVDRARVQAPSASSCHSSVTVPCSLCPVLLVSTLT